MAKNYIVNNLLCFISSAKNDYADEVLFDIIFSFYSVEDIKTAKDLISNLLNKDVITRKNPEKKKKDLDDLFELFNEVKETDKCKKDIFVSDSYKRMPPLGLEFIAPILTNLSEEITKINNLLPKVTDIKSEVSNTADTVRSMKIQLANFEKKFSDLTPENTSLTSKSVNTDNLTSIDKPLSGFCSQPVAPPSKLVTSSSPSCFLSPTPNTSKTPDITSKNLSSTAKSNKIVELQRNIYRDIKTINNARAREIEIEPTESSFSQDNFNNNTRIFRGRNKNIITKNNTRKINNFKNSTSITGSKQVVEGSFKSINKTVDLFLGRVDLSTTASEIDNYIKKVFNVKTLKTEVLTINNNTYNCFKISIDFLDRDKLFDSDKWPEGIIINKFYKRKSNFMQK